MKTFKGLCVLAALSLLQGSVFAQTRYAVIHNFTGGANDGANPQGDLILSGSTVYGMTYAGGSSGLGTIFKLNTDGTGFALLHSFAGGAADGANPYGSLTLSGSTLYGMTCAGGSGSLGTIFKINTDGTGFTILHSFAGGADGASPYGSLTLSGSTLFGMTTFGGSTFFPSWPPPDSESSPAPRTIANLGTVFSINTDGTGFAILYSFTGFAYGYESTPYLEDGANPYGSLTLSGSTLYGMTYSGGNDYETGTIFSIKTDGTGYGTLYIFNMGISAGPLGSLALSGSTFYGTTQGSPAPGDQSALFSNNGILYAPNFIATGIALQGSPTLAGSVLYGRTGGPSGVTVYYSGSNVPTLIVPVSEVFQVNTDGTGFTVLHLFSASALPQFSGPWLPQNSLTLSGTTLYGMTYNGGTYGGGMIFALNPNAPSVTTQPSNQTVAPGGSATFTVATSGPPLLTNPLTYQWQVQTNGSTTWTNLSDGANYSGTSTATLTVNSATAAMSGDLFQCVVSNGNGYDTSLPAAFVVTTPLTVCTLAGQGGHSGGSDGAGSSAQFSGPTDVAVDSTGNVYVADTDNDTIRKVTPAGIVSTVAGYTGVSGSVDGVGSAARFNHPAGVAVDGTGNIYVADTDNETIRKITTAGVVTTVAGQAGVYGSTDGTGSAARFNDPSGIAVDAAGNLYVADTLNDTLRKITSSGVVNTFAGAAGAAGSVDGTGTAARFHAPEGLAIDGSGNLYVADAANATIRKVVISTGVVTTVAGLAGTVGSVDGPGSFARFYYPSAVTVDGTDNLYVADTDNHTLREISPAGSVSTIAGKAGVSGSADGIGSAASFFYPTGITVDTTGNIYIADTDNDTIRLGYFPAAPAITVQPQSQTVTAGANVQFSVTASGKPSPTYQWNFNGTAISGATASSFSLSSVQLANAGDYTVTVVNSSGSVTSNKATLTVNAASTGGSSSGGGGGGAMEAWFVFALTLMAIGRWKVRLR